MGWLMQLAIVAVFTISAVIGNLLHWSPQLTALTAVLAILQWSWWYIRWLSRRQ